MNGLKEKILLSNGTKIPTVGFGTFLIPEGEDVINAVTNALEIGYIHFDTAAIYKNETGVGAALNKAINDGKIKREDIFVTTKVWNDDQGYENTLKAFEASLERLNLDYVDLYLIHWPITKKYGDDWKNMHKQTWKAMEELYKAGKIKALGVSNFSINHLEPLLETCEIKPMVNQIEMHIGHIQKETSEFCKKHGIVVEAWGPLGQGKILKDERLEEFAEKYGKSTAQICLRWLVQQGIVILPKSTNPERMVDNSNIFDFELLEEDMKKLSEIRFDNLEFRDPNAVRY